MSRQSSVALVLLQREPWWAFSVLCLGTFMIAVNTTIVNVAVPSIRLDMQFSGSAIVWVVNVYMMTFGGSQLLAGRLADLYGRRRLFLLGVLIFTAGSLACALSRSSVQLVGARSVQGIGGAIVSVVGLAQVMNLFTTPQLRAKAMSIYVSLNAIGGSIGLLLGGILTSVLGWRWVFLMSMAVGVCMQISGTVLLPRDDMPQAQGRLDFAGALTVTVSLMLATYAVSGRNPTEWLDPSRIIALIAAALLLLLFIVIESRAQSPLVPLALLRGRDLAVPAIVGLLFSTAVLGWRFFTALDLQLVQHFSPLQAGVAFLPAHLSIAFTSLLVLPPVMARIGVKKTLLLGLLVMGAGLTMLAGSPWPGGMRSNLMLGMMLAGTGAGMAYNPLVLIAMNGVAPGNSGTASGIINTAFTMGGALGLAVLAGIAAGRTEVLLASGADSAVAHGAGYSLAVHLAAILAFLAIFVSGAFIRDQRSPNSAQAQDRPDPSA